MSETYALEVLGSMHVHLLKEEMVIECYQSPTSLADATQELSRLEAQEENAPGLETEEREALSLADARARLAKATAMLAFYENEKREALRAINVLQVKKLPEHTFRPDPETGKCESHVLHSDQEMRLCLMSREHPSHVTLVAWRGGASWTA